MNRDARGRFKRQFRLSRTAPLIAFGGFLVGIAVTLGFVALGHAFPETEVEQVYIGYQLEPDPVVMPALVELAISCQEDEIIIGTGDYDGDLWEEYHCLPADDLRDTYAPEVFEQQPLSTLYEVQEGDNLWSLATAAGISLEQAIEFNDVGDGRDWNLIYPGEILVLG